MILIPGMQNLKHLFRGCACVVESQGERYRAYLLCSPNIFLVPVCSVGALFLSSWWDRLQWHGFQVPTGQYAAWWGEPETLLLDAIVLAVSLPPDTVVKERNQ